MHGGQALGHLVNNFLDQAEIAVLDIGQLDLAQQFFAQFFAADIGVEQKLPLHIVAHLLAQPVLAALSAPGPGAAPEH